MKKLYLSLKALILILAPACAFANSGTFLYIFENDTNDSLYGGNIGYWNYAWDNWGWDGWNQMNKSYQTSFPAKTAYWQGMGHTANWGPGNSYAGLMVSAAYPSAGSNSYLYRSQGYRNNLVVNSTVRDDVNIRMSCKDEDRYVVLHRQDAQVIFQVRPSSTIGWYDVNYIVSVPMGTDNLTKVPMIDLFYGGLVDSLDLQGNSYAGTLHNCFSK